MLYCITPNNFYPMDQKELIAVKQRYGIIGHDAALDRAIEIAVQVAKTDLSVLITGESGVGKESFSKIIHDNSPYRHEKYIAVNCGAIPEGTMDSELFGHEKGSFTGASEARKGYFEEANGGTIFLDEVAELPLGTQVSLLRVLENGEFLRVGSSKPQKTKVRVVAATNVNLPNKIAAGKFREDLYYRLNTVPIYVPPLRQRKDDIFLLFTKFASDFSEHYRVPPIELTDEALQMLRDFSWPGNIRQLKNITEQISIIEKNRLIDGITMASYLTGPAQSNLPVLVTNEKGNTDSNFEREIIYKFLIDMKNEVSELKSLVYNMLEKEPSIKDSLKDIDLPKIASQQYSHPTPLTIEDKNEIEQIEEPEVVDDSFSLIDNEKEMIRKALEKHKNNRRQAAAELGISERTLYRKINDFGL